MNQDSITVRADVVGSTDDFETNITLVYSPANFDHNPTPYNLDIVFTWKTPGKLSSSINLIIICNSSLKLDILSHIFWPCIYSNFV